MKNELADWRLIDTGPLDGATNMAVDEALLHCFAPERSSPILRLYGWEPAALSIGRFQEPSEVLDADRCTSAGIEVVSRITGGGVIYHASELTYAIVCSPMHIPPAASIKDSFRVLTGFLLGFYRKLGLSACYAADSARGDIRLGERTAFCFAGRETYDILVGNQKIGGNAQRRQRNVIFQHGSIPLKNHAGEGALYMREMPAGLEGSTAALADFGVAMSRNELKSMLLEAFREALPAVLTEDTLTLKETGEVSEILRRKNDR